MGCSKCHWSAKCIELQCILKHNMKQLMISSCPCAFLEVFRIPLCVGGVPISSLLVSSEGGETIDHLLP